MKARVTNKPADICGIKRENCNISLLSTPIYSPPEDSHRNAPCSCGSGKKYKQCCGKVDKKIMTHIDELNALMIELLENTNTETMVFNDRARELIDEISDFAENTDIYKRNKEKGEESLSKLTAWQTYGYMLDRIVNAPFTLFRNASVIMIIPILRQKLREEEANNEQMQSV